MEDNRKRVNISLDPASFRKLEEIGRRYGFRNTTQVVTALVRIYLDRITPEALRRFDLPEDEGDFLDEMFGELSAVEESRPGWRKAGPGGRKNE